MTPINHAWTIARATEKALAGRYDMPRELLRRVSMHFEEVNLAALACNASEADRLAIVQDLHRAFDAIVQIHPRDLAVLVDRETMIARTGFVQATADHADRILAASPILGPIVAEIARHDAVRAAWIAEQNARQRAEQETRLPADLLARLRADGIPLDLDRNGNIVAPRGAVLSAHDRTVIAERKPAFVALLKAEAAARAEAMKPELIA